MQKIAYLFGISLVLTSACAPLKIPNITGSENQSLPATKPNAPESKAAINKTGTVPSSFSLSGAIAAKSRQKGWTATVDWQQSGPHTYQITLMGPLGSQAVRIEEHQGVVTYREGAKTISSSNGDDLLLKKTGIHLPVNNLYYWVRGIPAPGPIQASIKGPSGQLKTLKQAGYTINYIAYMPSGSSIVPHKIHLQGQDLVVKLLIKEW